jgi:DNA polymerase V
MINGEFLNMLAPKSQMMNKISEMILISAAAQAGNVYTAERNAVQRLPLFLTKPYQSKTNGKPQFIEGKLDLNEFLIKNPSDTFLIRVSGDSMIKAGINSGDILVVDRTLKPTHNKIVIASINDKLLVKRIRYYEDGITLVSENDNYHDIKINNDDKFDIWGVVTSVIKTF